MGRAGPQQFETDPPITGGASGGFYEAAEAPTRAALPSLPESHRTIPFLSGASWFRKVLAFAGPGYLVAVGYMDPGNWATDIGGGSKFGYTLLSVILISNLMAMFLQALSAKLGIATGRDLAQACREHYSRRVGQFLWVVCEIAIAACDLAEVLGSAVALKLLFGLPLLAGVLITAFDVLIVLALQGRGFRLIEAFVVTLIVTIAACFAYEIFFAHPLWHEAAIGFIPRAEILRNREMLYIAIGILGATVMPHNLYLHSSIVQTLAFASSSPDRREAVPYAIFHSPLPRHHSCGPGHWFCRREQSDLVAHSQSGDSQFSVALRGDSPDPVHQQPRPDGRIRKFAPDDRGRLDRRRHYPFLQRRTPLA